MSNIYYENKGGELTIFASGRIDSSCADGVKADIDRACEESQHTSVVLDVEKLEYASSAGLRVFLRLRKKEPTLRIINASTEVFEILEMTGFAEMMPVSKAYRRLSVEGCEVIGQGANGKVYRLDADTIIKVYVSSDSLPDIHRERELARRAFVLGIPTAIPYDVVKVDDGYGSVFELLNAKSFAKLIDDDPDNLDRYVGMYIDLLKKIHSTVVDPNEMPDMRKVVMRWVDIINDNLPSEKSAKLRALVEAVPEDNHMLHGDFHIKNVMMQNDEVLLIDMDTLSHGHPVFELAGMFNAYLGFSELDHNISREFMGISHDAAVRIWQKSLEKYLETDDPERIAEVDNKARLIGYTRLLRRGIVRKQNETESGRIAMETYTRHIIELLDSVDTLIF